MSEAEIQRLRQRVDELEDLLTPYLLYDLGSAEHHEQAFEQLLGLGDKAVDAFLVALRHGKPVAREHAIEGLRRLKAAKAVPALIERLNDWNGHIVQKTIQALGEIGNPSVVRDLIPFLGNASPLFETTCRAIEQLGHHDLVQAFQLMMKGDKPSVEKLKQMPRESIVQALLRATYSTTSAHAFHALADLGAVEALPALRDRQYFVPYSWLRDACAEAVARLETLAALPKPSGLAIQSQETLPRPSSESKPENRETLPRVAEKNG